MKPIGQDVKTERSSEIITKIIVEIALEWETRFGVAPAITAAVRNMTRPFFWVAQRMITPPSATHDCGLERSRLNVSRNALPGEGQPAERQTRQPSHRSGPAKKLRLGLFDLGPLRPFLCSPGSLALDGGGVSGPTRNQNSYRPSGDAERQAAVPASCIRPASEMAFSAHHWG
jgi:hypothetical protein